MAQESLDDVRSVVARILPASTRPSVERVAEGVSTRVYRVRQGPATCYLRVLPEEGASLAPEVLVHRRLAELGVHVPAVLYFEPCNSTLRRSIMLTTEVPGCAAADGRDPHALQSLLFQAGRELALINSLPVQGFGWIRRDEAAAAELQGELGSYPEFVQAQIGEALALLGAAGLLSPREVEAIREIAADRVARWPVAQARLAHGDFDLTHIYHEGGAYRGIIDFGEIRGTDPFYDLGQFRIEHPQALPYLLEGYRSAAQLPPDCQGRIEFDSLLIGLDRLRRRMRKGARVLHDDRNLAAVRGDVGLLGSGGG